MWFVKFKSQDISVFRNILRQTTGYTRAKKNHYVRMSTVADISDLGVK